MTGPVSRTIRFQEMDEDGPFAIPETSVALLTEADLVGGRWHVVGRSPTTDQEWEATGDTLDEAYLRLLAARLAVKLEDPR